MNKNMPFKAEMEESERTKDSKIVLALDSVPGDRSSLLPKSLEILDQVHPYICALKLNRHLVLPLGLFDGTKKIVEKAHNLDLLVIMDCKINDVGYTNRVIAENYFTAGFDAVIANPFVGWEGGLKPVFEVARKIGGGVILLVYMSHEAAWEGYGQEVYDPKTGRTTPQYVVFARKALSWQADGAVVGATYPGKISETKEILGENVPIYSPGVGAQGGDARAAVAAGSRYLIVGRLITLAINPEEAAKTVRDAARASD
ncbi:MAG: orotidine 5'-phosphate decarboxylase [Candidatus Bathyarchaeota archaeon]|nr:orotidine 5'-phosphate decarboxylase [Candidatus Bathyarchaeota archaeon]